RWRAPRREVQGDEALAAAALAANRGDRARDVAEPIGDARADDGERFQCGRGGGLGRAQMSHWSCGNCSWQLPSRWTCRCGGSICTLEQGGIGGVDPTLPPRTGPRPIAASPPRIVAPA